MKKHMSYMLIVPGCVILTLFLVMPLLNSIAPTVVEDGGFTLSRYIEFFKDEYYRGIFIRTVKISSIVAIICMILGVPVAYYVSRTSAKVKGILIAATIFPMLTNSVVRSFAWITILGRNGIINNTLMKLGVIAEPLALMYTEFAVIIGTVYLFLPLMIISLVGVMDNIDDDLLEAAQSLGASKFKSFMKVVFPLSIPGLIVGAVLVFTGTMTAYTTPQLLGGNQTTVLATLVYQQAMSLGDWTSASVVATIMIITTILVIKILNKVAARLDKRGA